VDVVCFKKRRQTELNEDILQWYYREAGGVERRYRVIESLQEQGESNYNICKSIVKHALSLQDEELLEFIIHVKWEPAISYRDIAHILLQWFRKRAGCPFWIKALQTWWNPIDESIPHLFRHASYVMMQELKWSNLPTCELILSILRTYQRSTFGEKYYTLNHYTHVSKCIWNLPQAFVLELLEETMLTVSVHDVIMWSKPAKSEMGWKVVKSPCKNLAHDHRPGETYQLDRYWYYIMASIRLWKLFPNRYWFFDTYDAQRSMKLEEPMPTPRRPGPNAFLEILRYNDMVGSKGEYFERPYWLHNMKIPITEAIILLDSPDHLEALFDLNVTIEVPADVTEYFREIQCKRMQDAMEKIERTKKEKWFDFLDEEQVFPHLPTVLIRLYVSYVLPTFRALDQQK